MAPVPEPTYGIFKYAEPDPEDTAEDRAFYSFPVNKTVKFERQQLHDMRTSTEIEKGARGLDVQGFTWLDHTSALSGDDWFAPGNAENICAKEVSDIIRKATGADRVVVDGVSFRRKAPNDQDRNEKNWVLKRGCDLDVAVAKLPRNTMRVTGRETGSSLEPARQLHVDYSLKGLRDTARCGREDIKAVAQPCLDAEDQGKKPRYAVYSVWRPLDTVKKDPIAVLDWRTTDSSELQPMGSRALSGITTSGEYIRQALITTPPKSPESHRWYWIPEQRPDEVLLIKFADTAAETGNEMAAHCVHGAPKLERPDDCASRESVEARVMAFWD